VTTEPGPEPGFCCFTAVASLQVVGVFVIDPHSEVM
jgi:hypothetical protein